MIAKISTGSGFRGALDYIFKEDADVIGGNMAGDNPRALSKEFGITRALREDIEKPCYHISLALPKGEELDTKQWERIAGKYLSRMGIDPLGHQYILVQHKDTEFNHIHILTSRIALNGGVWKPEFDKMKSKDICRQLEKEHGLTTVSNEKKQYKARTTQAERRMSERTGREPEKVFIQEKLNELLSDETKISPQNFCKELEKYGIVAIPNVATTGKVSGFAFQYAGRNYTGSKVGYSWKHLEKFIDMKSEDVVWMQDRKNRLQEGTPSDAVRSIRNAVWETGIQGTAFDTALEKQGWKIQAGRMIKGESSYELSSIVDRGALEHNLRELNSISKKVKEKAQAKSRELAKSYHGRARKSFFAEMRTEDILCGMIMFPQVAVFLLLLSVITETVRHIERPKNENEFKERMRAIWNDANSEVTAEVKRIQEEMRNARNTGSNQTDKLKPEEPRRELRTADESGQSSMREMGTGVDKGDTRSERYTRRDTRDSGLPTLETANTDSDDSIRIRRGSSPSPSVAFTPGSEQDNGPSSSTSGTIEEWASLAQDLSVLARGDDVAKEKSKSVAYKEQVWDRQHSALQAPAYRVTVRGRGAEDGKTINLCKHKDGTETVWTADEVKAQIPSLEYWNARGYDIYITPMDEDYHHILIDDLTAAGVEHLKASGFSPCMVQTSSENNYQAIIRVPKAETSPEEQSAGNVLLQKLNTLPDGCGGDRAISAPRHPFRMTGFNNKKPSRGNVQTKIESLKPGAVCEKATSEMEAIREARAADRRRETEERNKIETRTRRHAIETIRDRTIQRPDGETDADKDFRFRWNKFHGLAKKNVREGIWQNVDDSAIDFRVCKEMMQSGYGEEDTAKALQRCSPGLFDRHRNPDDYVRRTIAAAMQEILREAPKNEPQGPSFFGR